MSASRRKKHHDTTPPSTITTKTKTEQTNKQTNKQKRKEEKKKEKKKRKKGQALLPDRHPKVMSSFSLQKKGRLYFFSSIHMCCLCACLPEEEKIPGNFAHCLVVLD